MDVERGMKEMKVGGEMELFGLMMAPGWVEGFSVMMTVAGVAMAVWVRMMAPGVVGVVWVRLVVWRMEVEQ